MWEGFQSGASYAVEVLCGCSHVCHDISVESGWSACVHKSGQASTREPADSDLQGVSFLDPAVVNGQRVDFHLFDMSGSVSADVIIVDPTAPCYVRHGLDEARLFSECEGGKRSKHVLNGATMVPLVVLTLGKLGPSAQVFLQSLADVACSTGVVDRGSLLRIAQQHLCFGSGAWHCVP